MDIGKNKQSIFQKVVDKVYPHYRRNNPIFSQVYLQNVLPEELWIENLPKLIEQEYESNSCQRIVLFKSINQQQVPTYWPYHPCTCRDVKSILQKTKKDKLKPYLSL